MWQDWVFLGGSAVFNVALLPSLLTKSKPHRATCMVTGGILVAYAITYATLGLWLAMVGVGVSATAYGILSVQRRGT
ncbi:MAG: hypothetical protein HY459_02045 [Parcubacteria group bacterium]|nr:hypothetical protein [Parcubacteria group bacterium]